MSKDINEIRRYELKYTISEQMASEIFRKVSTQTKETPLDMKVNPYTFSLNLSRNEMVEQAKEDSAIVAKPEIAKDMELMWLKETQFV